MEPYYCLRDQNKVMEEHCKLCTALRELRDVAKELHLSRIEYEAAKLMNEARQALKELKNDKTSK